VAESIDMATRSRSARSYAKALIDTANRFDRENPELRDEWGEHRTAINALVTWLDQVAENAAAALEPGR
jgi:hypothetical protein